jgi:hypothetical protein
MGKSTITVSKLLWKYIQSINSTEKQISLYSFQTLHFLTHTNLQNLTTKLQLFASKQKSHRTQFGSWCNQSGNGELKLSKTWGMFFKSTFSFLDQFSVKLKELNLQTRRKQQQKQNMSEPLENSSSWWFLHMYCNQLLNWRPLLPPASTTMDLGSSLEPFPSMCFGSCT